MKVIINGATAGSNFGDFIFARMFQDFIGERVGKENVYWYNTRFTYSDFFQRHLKNTNACPLKEIDALVYMSGGYFCGNDKTVRDYLFRYLNYFVLGLRCIKKRIPYAVIGLEVGHSNSRFIENVQKKLLKAAEVVVVRNQSSYDVAREWGVERLVCTADSVFAMEESLLDSNDDKAIDKQGGKLLFLHVNPTVAQNRVIEEKVVPVVNAFLEKHPEYAVLVSTDQDNEEQDEAVAQVAGKLSCNRVIRHHYDDPIALCRVIRQCDTVVTTKLHVGIVGMRFAKAVISFSGHTEKIARLYEQFDQRERTASLAELTQEKGSAMLEAYYDKPISVPSAITEAAQKNFEILDAFLRKVKEADAR